MALSPIVCIIRRWLVKAVIVAGLIATTTVGWIPTRSVMLAPDENRRELGAYLFRVVRTLSVDIGIRNYFHYNHLEAARIFIAQEFESLGYSVSFQTYSVNGQEFSNIVARKISSEEILPLIVGAHYDSCYNPGADDNASGVAGLLGLARLLSTDPAAGRIVFVAFVNEEPPFFRSSGMGSRVFSRSLREARQPIRGAVVLEMIGRYSNDWFSQRYLPLLGPFFPNKGNFIAMVGDFNSASMLKKLAGVFRRDAAFPLRALIAPGAIPGINFSDHWSFWQEKYPAVMVTDTSYLRNENYHSSTDLPNTLNYRYMAQVVAGLREAIKQF